MVLYEGVQTSSGLEVGGFGNSIELCHLVRRWELFLDVLRNPEQVDERLVILLGVP